MVTARPASQAAELAATRELLRLIGQGIPSGLWADGILRAGVDITDEEEGK